MDLSLQRHAMCSNDRSGECMLLSGSNHITYKHQHINIDITNAS